MGDVTLHGLILGLWSIDAGWCDGAQGDSTHSAAELYMFLLSARSTARHSLAGGLDPDPIDDRYRA